MNNKKDFYSPTKHEKYISQVNLKLKNNKDFHLVFIILKLSNNKISLNRSKIKWIVVFCEMIEDIFCKKQSEILKYLNKKIYSPFEYSHNLHLLKLELQLFFKFKRDFKKIWILMFFLILVYKKNRIIILKYLYCLKNALVY
ncbi:hypothetical protein [[Mycoplasma] mobile]|uniref:Uncharacterized protein n=1 Tax=Mycoplasma mobile (strain ATCC 43663 / 163K / NCTC 11711) TaxID=267748 RepID=Q6KHS8_MYCM1|nr:hypothetical protein [[Mycoplasma] mobile]AAT27850.1 hypothetical protein MMOB3640 [Mycoplasma mobile 163K]